MADQLFMHHKPSKLRLLIMAAGAALMFIVCSLLFADRASAHGWIENSRSDLCYDGINTGCGAVMYEPWSIEGRGDFPEIGVPDGQIAGGSKYPELDVQTENRWNKINMKGGPFTFHWDMVANHSTNYWDYYITKKGWDPNSPLKRSDLELFCRYEDNGAIPPMVVEHDCFIPNDRTGYYVIVGVWDIFDTVNAFYQVMDVNLTIDPSQPTTPAPGHPGDPNRFGNIRDWSPIRPYNPGEQVVHKGSIWQARWWTQGQEPGVHEVWQQIGPATGNPTAPAAPTGLTATAGNAQINLTWAPSSGATSYTVKRATTSGGPYTDVATGLTTPSYTNTGLTNGTTYYYVVSASNSAGQSPNSAQVSATPAGDPIASNLVLQYKAGDTNETDNQIKPHFNIKNNGTSAVDLSTLKIRYYFTKEGSAAMNGSIDWAQLGASNIQISFGNYSGTNSDTYVEIGFSSGAGSIATGGQSGEIQLRMSKADWSDFNEANDYSFDEAKTAFADWSRVVLYQNGTVVWGNEP